MSTSIYAEAAQVRNRPEAREGAARRLAAHAAQAAVLIVAVALGGCAGPDGSTLTAADLRPGGSQAPWQVAGPTVAPRAPAVDQQECNGTLSFVDDCDPYSVRYEGP